MNITWSLVRRHATAISVMLIGMAVLWGVLWILAAAQYRTVIDNWIAVEKARGNEVSYSDRTTGGFPRSIDIRFTDFRWHDQSGGKAQTQELTLAAYPWNWHIFTLEFWQNTELTIPYPDDKDSLTIYSNQGSGRVTISEDNDWEYASLNFLDVRAVKPSRELFIAKDLSFTIGRPEHPPTSYTELGISLVAQAHNMHINPQEPSPFGDDVPFIDTSLHVMGPLPDFSNRESVNSWSNSGGIVEFKKFNLEWGPLLLAAKGSLGFDDDLQAEGAFFGQIGGHDEVIKALLEHEWIAKRQAGMLNSALNLFAKPSKLTGKPSIEVPITVQLGGLFLGPVQIFAFPDIAWAKN